MHRSEFALTKGSLEVTGRDGGPLVADVKVEQVVFYLPDNGRGDAVQTPVKESDAPNN